MVVKLYRCEAFVELSLEFKLKFDANKFIFFFEIKFDAKCLDTRQFIALAVSGVGSDIIIKLSCLFSNVSFLCVRFTH